MLIYPGCPGKDAVKWVSVSLSVYDHHYHYYYEIVQEV